MDIGQGAWFYTGRKKIKNDQASLYLLAAKKFNSSAACAMFHEAMCKANS